MHRAEKRKAREITQRLAFIDHGQRGTAKASREALDKHRHPNPFHAGRQCEAIASSSGKRCKCRCVGRANRCAHHGGHELDPTCAATLRWHRRTGHKVQAIRELKKTLRETIKTITYEENVTVRRYIPPRAAGGRVVRDQALVMGVSALRALRDQSDPMAWINFVERTKRMKIRKSPTAIAIEAVRTRVEKQGGEYHGSI